MSDHRFIVPDLATLTSPELIGWLGVRVLRHDIHAPGWALLDLGDGQQPLFTPPSLRAAVVTVADVLDRALQQRCGDRLALISLSRFDQQSPTRPHRDGGPDASLLVLGYEPTSVPSQLSLLDHTHAALDRGLTPAEFLDRYNPSFGLGAELLRPYTTTVRAFTPSHYQILVINNSNLAPADGQRQGMLGVLHQADVEPRKGAARVINSVHLGVRGARLTGLTAAEVRSFVETGEAGVSGLSG
jgi:hypothetical protein